MRLLATVLAAITLLAACQQGATPTADRDHAAILAALQHLDPCDLLEPKEPVRQAGPHHCEVTPPGRRLSVSLDLLPEGNRYDRKRITLNGVKAYDSGRCVVHVPVSPTWVITFTDSQEANCAPAARITKLTAMPSGKPDSFRQWEACDLLRSALADLLPDYRFYGTSADVCTAGAKNAPPKSPLALTMTMKFAPDPAAAAGRHVWIANRLTRIEQHGRHCELSWSMGSSGRPDPSTSDNVSVLTAPDCSNAERYARLIGSKMASPKNIAPQQPLLYRPDEPDTQADRLCQSLGYRSDCGHFHRDIRLPGRTELVAAAARDSNVACFMVVGSVQDAVGSSMLGLATKDGCVFVLPNGGANGPQVWISAQPGGSLPNIPGTQLTIAGYPALHGSGNDLYVAVDGGLIHAKLKNLNDNPSGYLKQVLTNALGFHFRR